MEQTKALNALEPFLALSKAASSPSAASDLITRATTHPSTFIFSELLSTSQIQALSTAPNPHNASLAVLQIFSYGTYADYTTTPNLPELNPAQLLKLRQLSLLTLARDPSALSYSNLQDALGLSSARELEDLVISAIYAGLIQGALDPYNHVVRVSSVSPLRDLQPNSIPGMLSTLDEWSSRCESTLADLEKQIAAIRAAALKRAKEEEEWGKEVEGLLEAGNNAGKDASGKGDKTEMGNGGGAFSGQGRKLGGGSASKRGLMGESGEDEDDMDIDDDEDEGTSVGDRRGSKPAKKRGFMGTSFGRSK